MRTEFNEIVLTSLGYQGNKLDEYLNILRTHLEVGDFIGGSAVGTFEARLSDFTSCSSPISVANGTVAIELALRALDIGTGEFVAIPNFTFWATVEAVVAVGAIPLPVDIDIGCGISIDNLRDLLSEYNVKAVITAHLFGHCSPNLQSLRIFCQESSIPLIEDGAQGLGVEYMSKPLFSEAFVATCSFYPTKILGGIGDGGAIFTNDEVLGSRVRQLANHGRGFEPYEHERFGLNARLDSIKANFLTSKIVDLREDIEVRRSQLNYYRVHLKALSSIDLFDTGNTVKPSGYMATVIAKNSLVRTRLRSFLKNRGIQTAIFYPKLISEQPGFNSFDSDYVCNSPYAKKIKDTVFQLPIGAHVSAKDIEFVVDTLKKADELLTEEICETLIS